MWRNREYDCNYDNMVDSVNLLAYTAPNNADSVS